MQFACNKITPTAIEQASLWLTAPSETFPWLLVDGALIDSVKFNRALKRAGWHAKNAFALSSLSKFDQQAPQLISLPHQADAIQQGLELIVAIDPTAPSLSWFKSCASINELQKLSAYLAEVRVGDDMDVHCRFADTRVLPWLLSSLSIAQTQRLAATITDWQWFNREGKIGSWSSSGKLNSNTPVENTDHIQLTNNQFAIMLDASEADGIFMLLLDKTPEVVPEQQHGEFHAKLMRSLSKASEMHLTQPPDRLQFVMLSLTCGENFFQRPELADTWKAIREHEAKLSELMQSWSDGLWDVLQCTPEHI